MRKQPLADASAARQRLAAIHAELERLLSVLLRREPMFPACVYLSPRRCGNLGCHCASGELHPAWVMSFKEGDHMVNRSVPADERDTLVAQAEEYRAFRLAGRQWRKLSREAQGLFAVLQKAREIRREPKP